MPSPLTLSVLAEAPETDPEIQAVYDLIILHCEHDHYWRPKGARALRAVNRLEGENRRLRIAFWNFMRGAGVHQDMAIQIIRDAIATEAGTAETGTGSVHEGAGPEAIAQALASSSPKIGEE